MSACFHLPNFRCPNCQPYVTTGSDSLPVIVVPPTGEQIRREATEKEFHRSMRLLKANNGAGAMTEAMWLLYEDAYYDKGYSDCGIWKRYLESLEGEQK